MSELFARPPASAKPRVYWYWINGNLSQTGITADLEANPPLITKLLAGDSPQ